MLVLNKGYNCTIKVQVLQKKCTFINISFFSLKLSIKQLKTYVKNIQGRYADQTFT